MLKEYRARHARTNSHSRARQRRGAASAERLEFGGFRGSNDGGRRPRPCGSRFETTPHAEKTPTRPRKSARQDRSQVTVDAILEAAARLFAEGGLERVNTNQIAELAGVSIGSLYQYFPGKQAILGELIDRHSERTIARRAAKLGELADRPIAAVLREIVEILLEADTIDLNLHRVFLDKLPDAGRIEQRHGEIRRMTLVVRAVARTTPRRARVADLDVAAVVLVHALEAVTNAVVFEFPERLRDPALVDEITALATRYSRAPRAPRFEAAASWYARGGEGRGGVTELRAAVVGVGHLGRFHAEKYAALPACAWSGVVDRDPARAARSRRALGVAAFPDHRALAGAVDCASVAVPTDAHAAVGRDLLAAGIDVLVEKPLASTAAEGAALVRAADARRRASCRSGTSSASIRRCARPRPSITEPRFLECHRLAPFVDRGTDVDVIRDLMIHDLDVIQSFVAAEVERVEAVGVPVLTARGRHRQRAPALRERLHRQRHGEPGVDEARAHAAASSSPTRTSRSTTTSARVRIVRREPAATPDALPNIVAEEHDAGQGDPLRDEIAAFVDGGRARRTTPIVSGRDGPARARARRAHRGQHRADVDVTRREATVRAAPRRAARRRRGVGRHARRRSGRRAPRPRAGRRASAASAARALRAAGMETLVDATTLVDDGARRDRASGSGPSGAPTARCARIVRDEHARSPDPDRLRRVQPGARRRRPPPGVPVLYYISPQVWAWRRGRIRKIARRVDRLAVVFPFEVPLYAGTRRARRLRRPSAARPRAASPATAPRRSPRTASIRRSAWSRSCRGAGARRCSSCCRPWPRRPTRLDGARRLPVRAGPRRHVEPRPTLPLACAAPRCRRRWCSGDTYNLVHASDVVLVASGTATLETALLERPMVIVYRTAPLTFALARRLVSVPFIGMPNLIAGRAVVPELIQDDATADRMAAEAARFLDDPALRRRDARRRSPSLRAALGGGGAAERAAADRRGDARVSARRVRSDDRRPERGSGATYLRLLRYLRPYVWPWFAGRDARDAALQRHDRRAAAPRRARLRRHLRRPQDRARSSCCRSRSC